MTFTYIHIYDMYIQYNALGFPEKHSINLRKADISNFSDTKSFPAIK